MSGDPAELCDRRIRIETDDNTIEGVLRLTSALRTLDDLNIQGKDFVTLYAPVISGSGWNFGSDVLAVNRRSILFVQELSNPPQRIPNLASANSRASIRVRVGPYEIEGFLHVPPGGECVKWLNHYSRPFLSLTSVSVVGPTAQFATNFLAVNRRHILAAQEIYAEDEAADEALEMSFEISR